MGELLIIEPIDLRYQGAAPRITISAGMGGANLITNDPREIWIDTNSGNGRFIEIDLGKDVEYDAIYLGNTNAEAGNVWSIEWGLEVHQGYPGAYFYSFPMRLPAADGMVTPRGDCLYLAPAKVTARYIRITVSRAFGTPLEIGRVIIGKAFRPLYSKETGSSRTPTDTGARNRLDDGGLVTVSGSLTCGFKWVFGDLSDADANALWGIMRRRRTTEPILVIEDDASLSAESVHYCTMNELEGYVRADPSKNRIAMTVEDWL